jgi:hypothetical protein
MKRHLLALVLLLASTLGATAQVKNFGAQHILTHDEANGFAQTADNVAALRLGAGAPAMSVLLRGLAAPGDGGGGQFYWSAASTASDDGVNIIAPVATPVGRWLRAGQAPIASSVAPATPFLGLLWWNTALAPIPLNAWDGAHWVALGTLNTATDIFTPAGVGSVIEAWSGNLDALAAVTGTANRFPYFTSASTMGVGQFGAGLSFSSGIVTLAAPTASVLGGVLSSSAGSNQFATGISTAGVVSYAQPALSNLSGINQTFNDPTITESIFAPLLTINALTAANSQNAQAITAAISVGLGST